jgi:putative endonuclease
MSSPTQSRGYAYETLALEHLQSHGLTLVARQWRCRYGEIDLIMRDGAGLAFVEVRQRGSDAFGGALESVTPAKLAKLERTAQAYLVQSAHRGACRFDVVLIDGRGSVEWLKGVS